MTVVNMVMIIFIYTGIECLDVLFNKKNIVNFNLKKMQNIHISIHVYIYIYRYIYIHILEKIKMLLIF